ncbi:tyrosine-protein phosphatase [Actinokineospora pegani]|uniref:tyrosine-protein phosphatase n=1 Tax=Actinokineospora pegani TaxID=2654637 RepID=UPI001F238F48|nr:tyrosine-protein phosphatase [Actinokineospora pegani]
MHTTRDLDWPDTYNVRDLGGLPTRDGRTTRWGAVVRGDHPGNLTVGGWAALRAHGVRTLVNLTGDEYEPGEGLEVVHVPLDDLDDGEFWDVWGRGLDCTPLYYGAFLDRFLGRVARVVAAVADAPAGGVFVHCGGGRDRTGLVVLLLLAAVGVPAEVIADDYVVSTARLEPAWVALGAGDQTRKIEQLIASEGTTARQAVLDAVASHDIQDYLVGVVGAVRVEAIRDRLVLKYKLSTI